MSKNCVIANGEIYSVKKEVIPGKDMLWPTQGSQVYESSLKVDVTYQVAGSLPCKAYIFTPEDKLVTAMKKTVKFEIGAMIPEKESELPKTNTKVATTFIVPVNNRTEALTSVDVIKDLVGGLRTKITEDEIMPHYKGEALSFEEMRLLKTSISDHNQTLKKGIVGRLLQADIQNGSPMFSKAYGEAMSKQRMQLAAYSVRVNIRVRHNIFEEYSIDNLEEDITDYDYYVGSRRRYSRDRKYTVDIPITSLDSLKKTINLVQEWCETFDTSVKEVTKIEGTQRLVSGDQMSDKQITLTKKLEKLFKTFDSDENQKEELDDRTQSQIEDILSILENPYFGEFDYDDDDETDDNDDDSGGDNQS